MLRFLAKTGRPALGCLCRAEEGPVRVVLNHRCPKHGDHTSLYRDIQQDSIAFQEIAREMNFSLAKRHPSLQSGTRQTEGCHGEEDF